MKKLSAVFSKMPLLSTNRWICCS